MQTVVRRHAKKVNPSGDRTIINIYAANNKISKYMKEKLYRNKERTRQFNTNEDFSTPLSVMDRTARHKVNKEIEDLNNCKSTRSNRHL